jgi:BirA family transcriptional regulator, biotin operon repressor / biotin---[acetyl-CoA-carboxylase] ligase
MIGAPRVHWRRTDSTNERARALAAGGAPHGTLVTAHEQTAGRGRQGREWIAPPGAALLMSVVMRELSELLPLAAALAVCDALALDAAIKWPNDVQVDGEKLAGILVEGRPQEGWAVLGIGLNVSAAPPGVGATSLAARGVDTSVDELLGALVPALDRRLSEDASTVLGAWRERDALRGKQVRWREGSGTAAGIDDSGALLVETEAGRVTLDAGEVHLLR